MTTKKTMIRVPTPTVKKLTEQAKIRGMTKNGLVNYLISDFLEIKARCTDERFN